MTKLTQALLNFNRGILSKLALARVDLKRTALSAEIQTNWMPRSLGPMMLRPGMEYLGSTLEDKRAIHIPFIFSNDDTAILEVTEGIIRVRVDERIIERDEVDSVIVNGDFLADLSGWTDADQSGASSYWQNGYMILAGTGTNAAIRYQQVAVAPADHGKEHGVGFVITRGQVTLRIGSTLGGAEYVRETTLGPGIHSLSVVPTGNFYIQLSSTRATASLVDLVKIESTNELVLGLPTPWDEGSLHLIRWDQSGDVIFVACEGYQQRKIERRGRRSWSIVLYEPDDGPFRARNVGPIRLAASDLVGEVSLTATAPLFQPGHLGSLFRLTSTGQLVVAAFSGDNVYSDPIKITGVGTSRDFIRSISGAWSGTWTLQRSIGEVGYWEDFVSSGANQIVTYNDGLDNQIIYYRIGIKAGNYGSGTLILSMSNALGSITGVVRITTVVSETLVVGQVLKALGSTSSTDNWAEGEWSPRRGWPSAVALFEGRLWWAGKDRIWGSVSDGYESFDDKTEGDSAPISRSIGSGPVDRINWLLPLLQLVIGAQMAEHTARSSSLDEPLTPTNFGLKAPSTRGSTAVAAVKVDGSGLFVRHGRLFQLASQDGLSGYGSTELTVIAPEVGSSPFVRIAVQRYPDTRIHCVREDGKVAILVFDPAEDVKCWIMAETDGSVEDCIILPGVDEDKVYYQVARTIDGVTRRYFERWALESECIGGTLNKQADSFVIYSGAATTSIAVSHLEGEQVVCWADGKDMGEFTVVDGEITLPVAVQHAVVGLTYTASFLSTKLAYATQQATGLTQRKRVDHLALIMANTHARGLKYGQDATVLDDLPQVEDGAIVDPDYIHETYDKDSFEFPGEWNTDSRIYLEAAAPRPCTILAAMITLASHDKL